MYTPANNSRDIPKDIPGVPPKGMSFHPVYPFSQSTPIMQLGAISGMLMHYANFVDGLITVEKFAERMVVAAPMLLELTRLIDANKGWDGNIYPVTDYYKKLFDSWKMNVSRE